MVGLHFFDNLLPGVAYTGKFYLYTNNYAKKLNRLSIPTYNETRRSCLKQNFKSKISWHCLSLKRLVDFSIVCKYIRWSYKVYNSTLWIHAKGENILLAVEFDQCNIYWMFVHKWSNLWCCLEFDSFKTMLFFRHFMMFMNFILYWKLNFNENFDFPKVLFPQNESFPRLPHYLSFN